MPRHPFSLTALTVAGLAALLAPTPADAQYPVDDRASPMTAGSPYYASSGPGYSYAVPSAEFAGRHQFYPGKYTGYVVPSRFATSNGNYATLPSDYSPVMMTSLHSPEVYGSYVLGLGVSANTATRFQTRRDNLPSDYPVGTPYAPLSRPLSEVPERGTVELVTRVERGARPALIDVFVPEEARLTFQGTEMRETGGVREFQSPPLLPGRTYTYDIRATWQSEDARDVTRSKRLTVRAGDHLQLDFTRGATPRVLDQEDERPTLRTRPLERLRDIRPAPRPEN
jgi:uncharacterized protein (TIGR03000 family)